MRFYAVSGPFECRTNWYFYPEKAIMMIVERFDGTLRAFAFRLMRVGYVLRTAKAVGALLQTYVYVCASLRIDSIRAG